MTVEIDALVLRNDFPALAKRLGGELHDEIAEIADFVREDWSSNVRVDEGEYRDNIRDTPTDWEDEHTAVVYSTTPHAAYNERGSVTISAKPDAAAAGERGRERLEDALTDVLR